MNDVKLLLDDVVLRQIKNQQSSLLNLKLTAVNKQFAAVPYRTARLKLTIRHYYTNDAEHRDYLISTGVLSEEHRDSDPDSSPGHELRVELVECDHYGKRLSSWRSPNDSHYNGRSVDLSLPFEPIFASIRRFHQISIQSDLPNRCSWTSQATALNDALVSAAMKAHCKYGKPIEVRRILFSITRFSQTFPFGDQRSFLSLISPSTLRHLAIDDSGENNRCWNSVDCYHDGYFEHDPDSYDDDSIDHSRRSLGDALAKFENVKTLVILQLNGHLAGTTLSGYLKSLPSVQKLYLSAAIEDVNLHWFSETFSADCKNYQLKKLRIVSSWIARLAESSASELLGHLEAVNVHGQFGLFDSADSMAYLRSIFARLPAEARLRCYDYTGFSPRLASDTDDCQNEQRVANGLRLVLLVGSNGNKGSLFEMSIRIDEDLFWGGWKGWKTSFIDSMDRAVGILRTESEGKFGTIFFAFDDEIDVRRSRRPPGASLKFRNVSVIFSLIVK